MSVKPDMLTHAVQVPHGYAVRGTGMHPCQLVLLSESHPPKVSCVSMSPSPCVCAHTDPHTSLDTHLFLSTSWMVSGSCACLVSGSRSAVQAASRAVPPYASWGSDSHTPSSRVARGANEPPSRPTSAVSPIPVCLFRENGDRVLLRGSCLCGLMPHEDLPCCSTLGIPLFP